MAAVGKQDEEQQEPAGRGRRRRRGGGGDPRNGPGLCNPPTTLVSTETYTSVKRDLHYGTGRTRAV